LCFLLSFVFFYSDIQIGLWHIILALVLNRLAVEA